MRDIRKDMDAWSKTTYENQLDHNVKSGKYNDPEAVRLLQSVLSIQGIVQTNITGNSIQNLKVSETEGKIHYVNIFDKCYSEATPEVGSWSPLDMMYKICEMSLHDPKMQSFLMDVKYHEEQRSDNEIALSQEECVALVCGRAVRGFPSYLRELDLISQLEQKLPDNATIRSDRELDQNKHADLLIQYYDNSGLKIDEFYGWSFVSTANGIAKFEDKFNERKILHDKITGAEKQIKIPEGHHILFPCNLDKGDDCHGWILYNATDIDKFITKLTRFVNVEVIHASFSEEEIAAKKAELIQTKKNLLDEKKRLLETNSTPAKQPYNRLYGESIKEYNRRGGDDKTYNTWIQKRKLKLMTAEQIHEYERQQKAQKDAYKKEQKDKDAMLIKIDSEITKIDIQIDALARGLEFESQEPLYDEFCLTSKGEDITEKTINSYHESLGQERDEHIEEIDESQEEHSFTE